MLRLYRFGTAIPCEETRQNATICESQDSPSVDVEKDEGSHRARSLVAIVERVRYSMAANCRRLIQPASITSIICRGELSMATRIWRQNARVGRAQHLHDGANTLELYELQLG